MLAVTIANLSGAQTGTSVQLPSPPRQVRSALRIELALEGTITSITPSIQISADGSTWFTAATGVAAQAYMTIQTSATFVRGVTTGTGGPYTAVIFAGRIGGA